MFTSIIEAFTGVLNGIAQSNFTVLNTALNAIYWAGISTYIMYVIIKSYMSDEFNLREYGHIFLTITVIGAFIGSGNAFTEYVIPIVSNLGDNISSILTGNGNVSTGIVDNIINDATRKITDAWKVLGKQSWEAFFMGFIPTALATVVLIGSAFVYAMLVTVYILITKVMITVLLSLGGIFVMLYIFPTTRGMFQSWVSSCINFVLLNIIFSVLFTIISKVVHAITTLMFGYVKIDNSTVASEALSAIATASVPTTALLAISAVYLVGIYLVKFSITLASQLSSGVSLSHDLSGGMGNLKNKGISAMSGTMNGIQKGKDKTVAWVDKKVNPSIGKP